MLPSKPLAALALALTIAACKSAPAAGTPDAGLGGSGTTASATSSSTASASSSATGTGGGPACSDPSKDCPAPPSECAQPICTAEGKCATQPTAVDTPIAQQTAGDCRKVVCDGAGGTKMITDSADVGDDQEICTADGCNGSSPSHAPVAGDCSAEGPAPAHLCGDPAGPAAGKCVECNADADCPTAGQTCKDNACNGP
jgi:hypothetical protein